MTENKIREQIQYDQKKKSETATERIALLNTLMPKLSHAPAHIPTCINFLYDEEVHLVLNQIGLDDQSIANLIDDGDEELQTEINLHSVGFDICGAAYFHRNLGFLAPNQQYESSAEWFSGIMKKRLYQNHHKGNWMTCDQDRIQDLFDASCFDLSMNRSPENAADTANLAMMLAQINMKIE